MIPARIPGATRVLGAPANWDSEKSGPVAGLAIQDVSLDGVLWMVSSWEPTPEDLRHLAAGGHIHLWVQGYRHPVVGMGVSPPPLEESG